MRTNSRIRRWRVERRRPEAGSGRTRAFTLVEIMIAIGILSLVIAAIYSSWTAILRASKVGLDVAASVQRTRIAVRTIEDSLGSAQMYVRNQAYYSFVAENGGEASMSFVARLAKSFPRSGRFGDFEVRRVTFSIEASPENDRQLVLRQTPLVMVTDVDEREHPLILAKHVKSFEFQFWDTRLNDWVDEWKQTNQLPKLVMVTLKTADNAQAVEAQEQITRIISLPAIAVPPGFQLPAQPQRPGTPNQVPGQTPVPGQAPVPGQNPRLAPGQPGQISPQ